VLNAVRPFDLGHDARRTMHMGMSLDLFDDFAQLDHIRCRAGKAECDPVHS